MPEPDAAGADGPLPSLSHARDRIRRLRESGKLARGTLVTVHIAGGRYFVESSLVLEAEDSGSAGAPVVYRARGDAPVRLIGGRELRRFGPPPDSAALAPEARGRVLCADLKALGLNDYGDYLPRGHGGGSAPAAMELFFNSTPMTVARWPKKSPMPNRGFDRVAGVRGDDLVYDHDRPAQWKSHEQIFLHGYFALDWASNIVRVVSIDLEKRQVALDPPRAGHYGIAPGVGRFFWFNILEELTEPGEYCIDRQRGLLYFIPPEPLDGAECVVSTLTGPLLDLHDAEHIRFEGLTLEGGRGDGVRIRGGREVTVAGCVLRGIGWDGVRIEGGHGHAVESCDIFETGECGVNIEGGDAATLAPCRHRVHNCDIHHVAREGWTYFPAVGLRGVGASVNRCRLHDHRHTMLFFRGNDFLIEGNEFYNISLEGDDCGTMYAGRRFEWQGNVVRGNFIHHVGDSGRNEWGSSGVYLDDGCGGTRIEGNIFQWVNKGVLAGGGLNTVVDNNLFVECSPAIWFDERCASARADRGETMVHGFMKEQFYAVNAHLTPYSTRYPLMDYVHDRLQRGVGLQSLGCAVTRNVVVGGRGPWLATHWSSLPDYFTCRNNLVGGNPGLTQGEWGLFQLNGESPELRAIGFSPVAVDQIGLKRDAFRTRLEDTRTSMDVLKPVAGNGSGGRARLKVRNLGDVDVQGVERVEIKTRRHGPGVLWVDVPFSVPAGEERAFEFDVALPVDAVRDRFELFLFTRGERLRPVWTTMPVSYSLDTRLESSSPAGTQAADGGSVAARVRLAVRNVGAAAVETPVTLAVEPAEAARIDPAEGLRAKLPPGAEQAADFRVALAPALAMTTSRLRVSTTGEGIRPATLDLLVEHHLPILSEGTAVECLAEAMAGVPARRVDRPQTRHPTTQREHVADVQLAICGDSLALVAKVIDAHPAITEMLWDGSSIELYACAPDRLRIGQVFGNIEIGQVFLVPAVGGRPTRAYRFLNNSLVELNDVRTHSLPGAGGYTMAACVPLRHLGVGPDAGRFLFELMAQTGLYPDGRQRRATLFGSAAAFQDASAYGLMVRGPH